jgi:hypothetical protein
MFYGPNRAVDLRFRGMIPAHGVDCDGQHSLENPPLGAARILLLLDFDDFAAFVLAAVRARPVR